MNTTGDSILPRRTAWLWFALAASLAALFLARGPVFRGAVPQGESVAAVADETGGGISRENAVVRAVRRAAHAVVNISTEEIVRTRPRHPFFSDPLAQNFFEHFVGGTRTQKRQNLGSGVIINAEGYVLTNEHVVARAIKVHVLVASGEEFEARVAGVDSALDLAVLKIDLPGRVAPIPIGRSHDLMIGEDVIAIGNPFGLSHSVTRGVVSAVNRSIAAEGRTYEGFIQTDAAINPGNSGGPLLNILGELIGINAAILGNAEGIGFAIPIDDAMAVVEALIAHADLEPLWLGVMGLQPLTDDLRAYLGYEGKGGIVVAAVYPDSPAAKAGVKRGDVLSRMGDAEIDSAGTFVRALQRYGAGEMIPLGLFREGKTLTVDVKSAAFTADVSERLMWDKFGLRVEANSPAFARKFNLPASEGVVVTELLRGGPAHRRDFRAGDVILQINSHPTPDAAAFHRAMGRTLWQRSIMVNVARGPHTYWAPLDVGR